MIQISYDLRIYKENENIVLMQVDNDGIVHKITLSLSMIPSLITALHDFGVESSELPSERESSAKEKEFPSFDEMQPVQCTVDDPNSLILGDFIQLTEDLIRQGMTNGIGINKKQQEVLGVESLHKGWMQELIGKGIHISKYNEFLNLKGATSK